MAVCPCHRTVHGWVSALRRGAEHDGHDPGAGHCWCRRKWHVCWRCNALVRKHDRQGKADVLGIDVRVAILDTHGLNFH